MSMPHETDSFVQFMDKVGRFILTNKIPLLAGVLFVILGAIGFVFWGHQQEIKLTQINQELYEALKDKEKADLEKVKELIKSYSNYPVTSLALIKLYQKDLESKDLTQARNTLNQLAKNSKGVTKLMSELEGVHLLYNGKDYAQALENLEKIIVQDNQALGAYPAYLKGLILEKLNKTNDALNLYQEIYEGNLDDQLTRNLANQRYLWLLSQSKES